MLYCVKNATRLTFVFPSTYIEISNDWRDVLNNNRLNPFKAIKNANFIPIVDRPEYSKLEEVNRILSKCN